MIIDLKNHLNIKINIRGEVSKVLTKNEFLQWNKKRNVRFELLAIKQFKKLAP